MLAIIEDNVALFAVKKSLKIAVLAPTYAHMHTLTQGDLGRKGTTNILFDQIFCLKNAKKCEIITNT